VKRSLAAGAPVSRPVRKINSTKKEKQNRRREVEGREQQRVHGSVDKIKLRAIGEVFIATFFFPGNQPSRPTRTRKRFSKLREMLHIFPSKIQY
jgi:hypothetical protein